MGHLNEVRIQTQPVDRLLELVAPKRRAQLVEAFAEAKARFAGRTVMNVNSTATGGGVAEMLPNLLGYLRESGIDAQWTVIQGNPSFFSLTKRIHNCIHGAPGDGGELGAEEHEVYRQVMRRNAAELLALVSAGDFVVLHDPQTAGLIDPLKQAGARVVWRSHIGTDEPNEWSERAWTFLAPYVQNADAYVFSRSAYAPSWLDRDRLHIIPPSIDPFAPKNAEISAAEVHDILSFSGLIDSEIASPPPFRRSDGTTGRIDRHADVLQTGPPPHPDTPLVVQISRWDRLKDMPGVMRAFADHVAPRTEAHLLLAGPNVSGVTDDPEGAQVLTECIRDWRSLPHALRTRVHLACLPTADVDENAVIVNAIQRHAAVVTQKSLREGFGLTVAEALWKERPMVASRVGGIADQIEHEESGLLVDDPHDLAAFGAAVRTLLTEPDEARQLGRGGRARVRDRFLTDRHLLQFARLTTALD